MTSSVSAKPDPRSSCPLVLVHLSDIHFSHAVGQAYDVDADVRNELQRDAVATAERLGPVRGVLVTGDVAYAGKKRDYDIAAQWLESFCTAIHCPPANVWTTPGNHDVDRTIYDGSDYLRRLHSALRKAGTASFMKELSDILKDSLARQMLYKPLENYNEFAARFGCDVTADRPRWESDILLNDGSILRLCGLNSVLVSNTLDNNLADKLFLGSHQSTLLQNEGIEYVTLCHHPPDWLLDFDEVEDGLRTRAKLQLFGHKHAQRMSQIDQSLRLVAGAMHPERSELQWRPRYNFILIQVTGRGGDRTLSVDVYPRVWDEGTRTFVGEMTGDKDHRHFDLKLAALKPAQTEQRVETVDSQPKVASAPASAPSEAPMDAKRVLAYSFLSLPFHTRVGIAQQLSLLRDEDKQAPDPELFRRVFQRASERGILADLWNVVAKEKGTAALPNPFRNA